MLFSAFTRTLVLSVAMVVSGCRTFTSPARSRQLSPDVTWLDYDATRRGTLVMKTSTGTRVLAEPSPDVALGVVSEFVGKASYQGISGEASAKVTESIAELGKRTETIMFLRESLFRLNELQTVTALEKAEVLEMYRLVLQTALELAKIDQLKEAQLVDPAVARQILSASNVPLRVDLDELLERPARADVVPGQTFQTVEDYAEYLVRTDPEFRDQTLAGIRARGGEPLRRLTEKLRAAAAPPAPNE
jgi:hypothetical protein